MGLVHTIRDFLPRFFSLPEQDPNVVLRPYIEAFVTFHEDTVTPEIVQLSRMVSIDHTREIDNLLANLGNPFPIANFTEEEKRRLAHALFSIYKQKGTAVGIEQAILYFTGVPCVVVDFADDSDNGWILGISQLGFDTFLNASPDSIDLFTFLIEFSPCLTDEQKELVEIIVAFMKPGWTRHIVRDCLNTFDFPLIEEFEDDSWQP